jgi:hypothetical protein
MIMQLRHLLPLALGILLALPATAQERANEEVRASPNAVVGQTIGMTDVLVTYGRPSVRDREIYGGLVPYDAVWRTGANEATTITFSDDVMIEGQPLAAGTYSLFTIPGEDEWTVIFNSVANQWGAYDYDEASDVLRVSVEPEEADFSELMTFSFDEVEENEGELVLHWDETAVPLTIVTGS